MEKIIEEIIKIVIKLADKLVLDTYLEELSQKDYNILTKKDKNEIIKAEEGNIERGILKSLGIAKVLKKELDKIGMENNIIKGFYEGNSRYNYYWNEVKIGEEWYNIDLSYDLEYIRARTMPDFLLVKDEFLTFQKKKHNLDVSDQKEMCEKLENIYLDYSLEVQKIIEETIENFKEMNNEEKRYITELEIKMRNKYYTRTNMKYLNQSPYYNIEKFIEKDEEELEKMPYASQELDRESAYGLRGILSDEKKYAKMFKYRNKISKFFGRFKSLKEFIQINNGIYGKLERLRIDEFGRKIQVIIEIEDEKNIYYYIDEFLEGLERLEEVKNILIDKIREIKSNEKGDNVVIYEIIKYILENSIIDENYYRYSHISGDNMLYNEVKEIGMSQGIERIKENYFVCASISVFLKELLDTFYIENSIIEGIIKYKEKEYRHQWNEIKLEEKWYIVDLLECIKLLESGKEEFVNRILVGKSEIKDLCNISEYIEENRYNREEVLKYYNINRLLEERKNNKKLQIAKMRQERLLKRNISKRLNHKIEFVSLNEFKEKIAEYKKGIKITKLMNVVICDKELHEVLKDNMNINTVLENISCINNIIFDLEELNKEQTRKLKKKFNKIVHITNYNPQFIIFDIKQDTYRTYFWNI